MINKILGIRRIGWRIQPPKQWRKNKKSHDGDGFEKYLEEAQNEPNITGIIKDDTKRQVQENDQFTMRCLYRKI